MNNKNYFILNILKYCQKQKIIDFYEKVLNL